MNGAWTAAAVLGAMAGAVATSWLTVQGLGPLVRRHAVHPGLLATSAVAGCAAGGVAVVAAHRAGTWWIVPALLVWACALVAAAACDAATQRIPTSLVRQAGVGAGGLLIVGLTVHGDWRGMILSGAAAAASGLIMLLCWRFAGAGFGDVRLAMLGGLGLGHVTYSGAMVGLVVFCVVTLIHAGVALARGGNRHTTIAFGPALATAMMVAAAF